MSGCLNMFAPLEKKRVGRPVSTPSQMAAAPTSSATATPFAERIMILPPPCLLQLKDVDGRDTSRDEVPGAAMTKWTIDAKGSWRNF